VRPHAFQQVEFGFPLGPGDGRFLIRAAPGGAPDHVLVLGSLVSTERARRRDRARALGGGRRAGHLGERDRETVARSTARMEAALAARRLASAG
jgi:hypothetical protein